MTAMTDRVEASFRQRRLSYGWDPIQMIGHMKIEARRMGELLPPAWLLVRWVFLWENHRTPIPTFYVGLLTRVFHSAGILRTAR